MKIAQNLSRYDFPLPGNTENKKIRQGLGPTADKDSKTTTAWVNFFKEKYEKEGYTFVRLEGTGIKNKKGYKYSGGKAPEIFVYKDIPLVNRMSDYFLGILDFDNIRINFFVSCLQRSDLLYVFFSLLTELNNFGVHKSSFTAAANAQTTGNAVASSSM